MQPNDDEPAEASSPASPPGFAVYPKLDDGPSASAPHDEACDQKHDENQKQNLGDRRRKASKSKEAEPTGDDGQDSEY
jgi:hypothetical protein